MRKVTLLMLMLITLVMASCHRGQTSRTEGQGDTVGLKYAELLTIVRHSGYTEAVIANPWQQGSVLHRYLLVAKGRQGDATAARLQKEKHDAGAETDIVRTPVASSTVFTSPHCQLLYELGRQSAITGVCDLQYINIPDIKRRCALPADSSQRIADCGSSMQPSIERIVMLRPEAVVVSPFENSGGYGKLGKLGIPVIEAADYMETSPLGRAEWIRFYAMLFGGQGDSLFASIEEQYLGARQEAAQMPLGLSILTERKMGSVWYVPGGKSTTGILLRDAHARYIFSEDTHSGSLALSPEQILVKAGQIDVLALKYLDKPLTKASLLQEYPGYAQIKAFRQGEIYQCDTGTVPYFEQTSFHPERLLREFILLSHPELQKVLRLKYYHK